MVGVWNGFDSPKKNPIQKQRIIQQMHLKKKKKNIS